MPNKLTVTFEPCTSNGLVGYLMSYRVKNSSEPYRSAGKVTTSPAVVYITGDPDGSLYEGYIESVCLINGKTVKSPRAYFSNVAAGVNSLEVKVGGMGTVCSGDGLDLVYYTGAFGSGTVVYKDAAMQTKYNTFSFISTGGVIYQVNLSTGVITNVGNC